MTVLDAHGVVEVVLRILRYDVLHTLDHDVDDVEFELGVVTYDAAWFCT